METKRRQELYEVSGRLAKVALGREKADLVVQNGTLVNVYSGELLEHTDIAVAGGRVAFVGKAGHTIGPDTKLVDAEGRFLVPGLIDGHMHVESTMMTVTEFAKAALAKGTTAVFMDPHEIANVFGNEGVAWMHEEGQGVPLKVFTTYPSCVPAAEGLEDAGASLEVEDIEAGLRWEGVAGLGEVMNFPGVVYDDPKMKGEIEATIRAGKTVTGHFPSDDQQMLQAYIASGVTSDHETVTREQGLARVRLGMNLMIREGSAWQDVKEVIKVVTEDHAPTGNITLVTDDVYPQTLVDKGHINHVVRRAVEEGVDPVTAIQMATINTARYFNMERDLGAISPGKCADILLVDDLQQMVPSLVIADGAVVARQGRIVIPFPSYVYPEKARQSVQLARKLRPEDFRLRSKRTTAGAGAGAGGTSVVGTTRVKVIQVIENSARTASATAELTVKDGYIQPDPQQDVLLLACIERHKGSGDISLAFAKGFGLKEGAVASTVAHDSHNLLVMGTNEADMVFAASKLAECGGGMIAVKDGKVLGLVEMPVAGLMSDKPLDQVVEEVRGLEAGWKELGCTIHAPFMTFSLIALPVIPDLRISNRGLVDVTTFRLTDVEL
ncbi:adenosine deaminase [Paenibacillus yonginensis]|uniref:Adenine deaminase n=1 Tax=Paenibacillus yonginensis TaxID=1462996 RepID=A0A1B1N7H5_9BACL|nr:adenine deaminase [Paenibacillus yonginensis]ANS77361.1 adenosine deaminase [Paenibacillus yonginensis]